MSLNEDNHTKTLVIGIGNPLRCDDGVGPYVADCIEAKSLSRVKVWIAQQLHVEDLERMLDFNQVILVDASIVGSPLEFRLVESVGSKTLSSSHHLSAETFVSLAPSIYHQHLRMHVCSIRGNNFEVGSGISPEVLERAHEAVELICSKI